jgi:hypothetical protein
MGFGDELRKPRFDKTAREAAVAAERLAKAIIEGEKKKEVHRIALDHLEQGVRGLFAHYRPNASTLIGVLDHVRLIYRAIKDERGIDDEKWEDPHYGKAGRRAGSAAEQAELDAYLRGQGERPFWWFDEE